MAVGSPDEWAGGIGGTQAILAAPCLTTTRAASCHHPLPLPLKKTIGGMVAYRSVSGNEQHVSQLTFTGIQEHAVFCPPIPVPCTKIPSAMWSK
jgi:hypothetical protein